jgi:hypothetical protein
MEIMIELTDAQLKEVAGGSGSASFSFTNSASGTTAIVAGAVGQLTTASSAIQAAAFVSLSS